MVAAAYIRNAEPGSPRLFADPRDHTQLVANPMEWLRRYPTTLRDGNDNPSLPSFEMLRATGYISPHIASPANSPRGPQRHQTKEFEAFYNRFGTQRDVLERRWASAQLWGPKHREAVLGPPLAAAPAPSQAKLSARANLPAPAAAPTRAVGFKEPQSTRTALTDALATKFTNIRQAFHYVDVNNDGFVSKSEIKRALDLFNMETSDAKIDELFKECDKDGNGKISYDEFVDALARDTVSLAAMGKRGMQSKDAMGVDAYELLDEQLRGRGKIKHAYSMSEK